MRAFEFGSWRLLSSVMIVSALSLSAFEASVGYGAYAAPAPNDIYSYPHAYYNGANAYLVGDRWYYPQRNGWVVLRDEPPPLYRYRTSIRSAPPPPQYRPVIQGPPRRAPYAYPPPPRER